MPKREVKYLARVMAEVCCVWFNCNLLWNIYVNISAWECWLLRYIHNTVQNPERKMHILSLLTLQMHHQNVFIHMTTECKSVNRNAAGLLLHTENDRQERARLNSNWCGGECHLYDIVFTTCITKCDPIASRRTSRRWRSHLQPPPWNMQITYKWHSALIARYASC